MRRIDAEQLHLRREVRQLVERPRDGRVVGVPLDVGVELGGGEVAVDHVALELGHVDAVGGEAAHRLVERRRDVPHPEDEGGQRRAARHRPRFGRHDKEAGGVVRLVLDVARQHVEAVDLAGEIGGQRRQRRVAGRGDDLGRARGVGADARGDAVLGEKGPALAEERRLAERRPHLLEPGAGHREQVRVHPHEMLTDDVEARLGQEVVDVGDPPVGRVLDRQHREVGPALLDRGDRTLEAVAREAVEEGKRLVAGLVRIGAARALERDPARLVAHVPEPPGPLAERDMAERPGE